MKFILVAIGVAFLMFLGAFAHEGDIQTQCREHGKAGYSAWRGELICAPQP